MTGHRTDIKFACSQCGQRLVVERSAAGLTTDCPFCEKPVTVPGADWPDDLRARASAPSEAKQRAAAEPTSEEMREDLFDAALSQGELQREVERLRGEHEALLQTHRKALDECERLAANLTHSQVELRSFQSDRQQLRAESNQVRQRLAATDAELAETRAESARLASALAAADEQNAHLQGRIERDAVALGELETMLSEREKKSMEWGAHHEEVLREMARAQAEIAELKSRRAELERAQNSARAETTQLTAQAASRAHELQTLREDFGRIEVERAGFAQRCEALVQEVAEVRRETALSADGRELLAARDELRAAEQMRKALAASVAEQDEKIQVLSDAQTALQLALDDAVQRRVTAEKLALAGSESRLYRDNQILRGIVARQNGALDETHLELRRLRRERLAMRILYALLGLASVGVIAFAVHVFNPAGLADWLEHFW